MRLPEGPTTRHPPTLGFSLTELLVVLGVIALLLGILLPILSRIHAAASSTDCRNNLRRIAEACHIRASENAGFVGLAGLVEIGKPIGPGLPENLSDSSRRRYQYLTKPAGAWDTGFQEELLPLPLALAQCLSSSTKPDSVGAVMSLAETAVTGVLRCFQCPAASADNRRMFPAHVTVLDSGSYTQLFFIANDYGFNGGIFAYHFENSSIERRGRGALRAAGSSRMVLAADIRSGNDSKAATAAFTPSIPGGRSPLTLADADQLTPELVIATARPDTVRHHNRLNVAFVDGHVESVSSDALNTCRLTP